MDTERPSKRAKLLSDEEDSDSGSSSGGVTLGFNEEYARRFEHNKKRAEQHRLEERYGKTAGNDDGDSEESSDEEEDEEAELATGLLDDEFQATLKALQKKDPRIYNKEEKFYSTDPDAILPTDDTRAKEKPLYLSDYHRQNLLNGNNDNDEGVKLQPTYAQEQESLRKSFLAAAEDIGEASDSGAEEAFLARKEVPKPDHDAQEGAVLTEEIRIGAKEDPDRFLSTFMDSKGWLAGAGSKLQAFESDDDDFDDVQDEFEHKYNMRFEVQDNKGKIQGFDRDIASQYSVRKDTTNKRQRAREAEKQKKDDEKAERIQEKARLRKLKLDEAEEKLRTIKRAAGLNGKSLDMEQWSSLLTGDWDDNEWQNKFEEHFDESYYAGQERPDDSEGDEAERKRKKPKKPKFDDDIDITDLVPDFEEERRFSLTEDESEEDAEVQEKKERKKKKGKSLKKEREEAKREARRERRKLEALVDEKLDMDIALGKVSTDKTPDPAPFRYRETSPTSFGLTASEILLASDAQLNEFAGLKKLAAFRDPSKKQKDRKHLGKKARLRKWRKETFGNEEGPRKTLQEVANEARE